MNPCYIKVGDVGIVGKPDLTRHCHADSSVRRLDRSGTAHILSETGRHLCRHCETISPGAAGARTQTWVIGARQGGPEATGARMNIRRYARTAGAPREMSYHSE